tara:strand:+ start:334 stop:441 length:108 start_codon:yes stop_codon:yes gene_type:complete
MLEVALGFFCLFSIIYFIFIRIGEKKDEKFEKRKW